MGHREAILGGFGALLEQASVKQSWIILAQLAPSWGYLGTLLGHLEAILDYLRAMLSHLGGGHLGTKSFF